MRRQRHGSREPAPTILRILHRTRTIARVLSSGPVSNGHILRGFASSPEGSMSDRTRKLLSIRHRTDHDLLVLVSRELDRGFALVDVATTRSSPLFAQAEKAYDMARALLPRIADLSEGDRLHLESRLKELRVRFDQVATFARVERYTASVA